MIILTFKIEILPISVENMQTVKEVIKKYKIEKIKSDFIKSIVDERLN